MQKALFKKLAVAITILICGNTSRINAQCIVGVPPPNALGCIYGDAINFLSINGISSPFSSIYNASGYGSYTTTTTWTINTGISTTFSANVGGSSSEAFGIWIDLNKDGFYNSTNEQLFSNAPAFNHSGAFIIPSGAATTGTYNLRARCAYLVTQTSACDGINYGEAEDYVIQINALGAALNFDGVNDRVDLGTSITNSISNTNKITVEAWVKPLSLTGIGTIHGNYNTINNSQMQYTLRRNGANYEFYIGNGSGGSFSSVNSINTATLNVWHHVAGTWDGSVARIYINGILSNTASISYPSFGTFSNPIWIGSENVNPEKWNGDIDEVKIWNRVLCAPEILNNFAGQITLPQTGLLAYYQFNQGLAAANNSTVTSLIGLTGPTGTLTNFALTTGTLSNWSSPSGVSGTSTVTAFVSPTLSIASPTAICSGSSTTLTASGVSSYTWTSGPTTATFAVTPSVTTTYSVVGTATNGCLTNVATRTINVNTTPTVAISNSSVCGSSATGALSTTVAGTGPYTYAWSTGSTLTAISGLTPGTYAATVTAVGGCTSSASAAVISNPLPTVAVNNGIICSGSTFTIVPSGANTYTIQGGSASVTPTTNSTYTVVGTSTAGCVSANIATSNVTVNALPTVSAASSNTNFICVGSTATLTAAGANTYVWNTTATTSVIAVSPTTTTSYTVTGTDANGCSANAVLTQSVSTCTGIDNLSLNISNLSFQVYPNPSNGIFNIELQASTPPASSADRLSLTTIEITDVLGRVILTDKVNAGNYQLNLGNNVNGIYFVKATVDGKTKTVKIVKE